MAGQPNPFVDLRDNQIASMIIESATSYAIMTMDFDGVITAWSPGAELITGYSAEEALGSNFSRFFSASDLATGADKKELETARRFGRAEDSRWHHRKDGERFWANGMTMRLDVPANAGLLKVMRDETPSKRADEQRVLLLNELNHRINNTLATVQSIAEQTLRAAAVDQATRANLLRRLSALSEAHKVLVDHNWAGADLRAIITSAIGPHVQVDRTRFRIDGPDVQLSPPQAVSMSLGLHELVTNALKYGALSIAEGSVSIDWNQAHDGMGGRHMTLTWKEHDGPAVQEPTRKGFGSRLLQRTFSQETGGSVELLFEPSGVRCSMALTLTAQAEGKALDLAAGPAASEQGG